MSYRKRSLEDFLKALSSADPVPGGGAVAALCATLAFALSAMVVRIRLKRKGLKRFQPVLKRSLQKLNRLQTHGLKLFEMDPRVYRAVRAHWGKPSQDGYLERAFRVQERVARLCLDGANLNRLLLSILKGALANDLRVSQELLRAARRSSAQTAQINLRYVENRKTKKKLTAQLQKIKSR